MFSSTPPGFSHASLSKGVILLLGINTTLVGIFKNQHLFDLALYPHIFSSLSGRASLIPACNGLLVGVAISSLEPLNTWRVPVFVRNWAKTAILPWLASPLPTQRLHSVDPMQPPEAATAEILVSEEDIAMLESMGFQRDAITQALQLSRNDVQRAIALLLER
ncbi:hypothetical protein HDU91_000930 [Kappamyces sp. JEL0680]|nr:hypothetical protein HDU91_000930 [Kappamyces sp. JEL0680]